VNRSQCFPLLFILLLSLACQDKDKIRITIKNEVIAPIDERIFGHFMEKPSWGGEWGVEAAVIKGTHDLQDGVFDLMKEMHIPVLRFPGGTDVNHQDWTDMIDNIPGREGGRSVFVGHAGDTVTNMFGYDEACRLAEKLGSEMILVINFGDAYFRNKPLEEAVLHETGLLAYCNAPVGTKLPERMPDWPSIRAKNGHPEPYHVKYIQICNEPWVLDKNLKLTGPIDPDLKEHFLQCQDAFIDMLKKIDPDIQLIVDGNCRDLAEPLKDRNGDQIDYVAYHVYKPWGINTIEKDGKEVPFDSLTEEDIWKTWIAVPEFNAEGMSVLDNDIYNNATSAGYNIAATEWNWNGWWRVKSVNEDIIESRFTKGIGAAGFIHAFMREGNRIKMANQSMLVGKGWDITGIRVSPHSDFSPHPHPTGQVTGFYSQHHGNELLSVEVENNPVYKQPYRMSWIVPAESVAYLDILATRNVHEVFLHIINRHFSQDLEVQVDLNDLGRIEHQVVHKIFEGNLDNEPCSPNSLQTGCFREEQYQFTGKILLPERSISILKFDRMY
jgi:alpha-N-arabinofuranosidase